MYRKVLITALMLSIGMVGFSKTEEIKSVNPKELAKTVAENSQKELLGKMQHRLKERNEKFNLKFGKNKTEGQQFLYQENLIDSVLKAKSHLLTDVYEKLCEKSNMPTDLVYERININNIAYKTFQKKGMEKVDSTTLIVPVSFQAHTVAKDGVSDVKYAVTFKWEVKVKEETEKTNVDGKKKNVIVGYVQNGAPTLISSVASPIQFLTSDKEDMKNAAQKAIIEWYANLPKTLDKQYAEQSVTAIETKHVTSDSIKMELPKRTTFTITDVPKIRVCIDPYQFIDKKDRLLYTNPVAQMVIAPTFNVSVDDTFKKADISVSYVVDTVKPITDSVKLERSKSADTFIKELAKQLSTYVSTRDTEQKAYIENMFDTTESTVEVSYLPKYGTEKIKTESAQKYLSLLKGSSLNWDVDNLEVVNPNWDSVIYTVNQEYQSKTYSDYTLKRIYLIYDSTKSAYLINKIEVIPNSTKIE